MIVQNSQYEILTPSGFSAFKGIKKVKTDILFTLTFSDGSHISCTENHKLKYPNGEFLEACHILLGDELFGGKIVVDKTYEQGEFEVYDVLDVELKNEYYSSGVVSHNCAHIDYAEEIWTAAQPTLSTGGKCILLSTPNGQQGLFYRIWQQAEEGTAIGGARFNPISLPWYLHPERDQAWRDEQDTVLGKREAAQECDCDFLTSGNTVIDPEILQFCTTKLEDPIEKRGIGGDLWIWKYPEVTKSYLLAADPSRGDGEDYSGLVVMEIESNEQVAEFKGKIDTQTFGRMCVSLATEYNNALLIIDNKNVGWSTVQVALDSHYPNLYYSYKNDPFLDENIHLRKMHDLKQKEDMVPGLTTTTRIRPVLISKLEMYFRDFGVLVRSKRLLNELKVFMWLGGKAQAQRGYNDDLVMALAMSLYIRDTSLKLHQMGVELNRFAIKNTYKSVYKPLPAGSNQWEMAIGPNGQKENLKWLLK